MKNILGFLMALVLVGAGCTASTTTEVKSDGETEQPALFLEEEGIGAEAEGEAGVEAGVQTESQAPAGESEQEAGAEPESAQAPSQEQTSDQAPEQLVTVVARFSGFEPSQITVKKGTRVRLQVVSIDAAHTFTIPGYNVNLMLSPGVTATQTFSADTTGTFPFRCNFHGSMTGSLVVE